MARLNVRKLIVAAALVVLASPAFADGFVATSSCNFPDISDTTYAKPGCEFGRSE
jgi:hypothetical protein